MSKTLESLVALTCIAVLFAIGGVVVMQAAPAAHASGATAKSEHVHEDIGTTAVELNTDTGDRHFHYACCVDDAETGSIYVGDSSVSSSDYGAIFTAGECWGGPHGGEYARGSEAGITIHCRYSTGGL